MQLIAISNKTAMIAYVASSCIDRDACTAMHASLCYSTETHVQQCTHHYATRITRRFLKTALGNLAILAISIPLLLWNLVNDCKMYIWINRNELHLQPNLLTLAEVNSTIERWEIKFKSILCIIYLYCMHHYIKVNFSDDNSYISKRKSLKYQHTCFIPYISHTSIVTLYGNIVPYFLHDSFKIHLE